jgi:glycine/D-amino acid oxidase-like deaminating enzyme
MMKPEKCQALRDAAVVLMGKLESESTGEREIKNVDDLDILQEGLCFRPWTKAGIPIVSKISEGILGDKAAIPSGGVFAAVAHGPWGISLSLGTGKVVAEMVAGKTPSADVSGLGL